jgi:hypothetical protein
MNGERTNLTQICCDCSLIALLNLFVYHDCSVLVGCVRFV